MVTDLIFIVAVLVSACSLLTATWLAGRGQFGRARRILMRALAGAVAYMLLVVAASAILSQRTMMIGERQCFDDICVAVDGSRRVPDGTRIAYGVDIRLSSRARGTAQRENHLVVYLVDGRGQRYDAVADVSNAPLNVLLRPEESVVVSRTFSLPGEATGVGAAVTHEGGFPIGWFIIGYDGWFRKPPVVPLQ